MASDMIVDECHGCRHYKRVDRASRLCRACMGRADRDLRLKEETEEKVAAQERVRVLEPKARAYEDFCEAPDLLTVRDAAAQLTTAGLPIRECELRAWMLDHEWIYRHNGAYRPYASHSTAGHLRLVPPKRSGRHRDGTPFPFDPTCKITRRGLTLLYQRIGAERMRDQLHYGDTQYPFDEED